MTMKYQNLKFQAEIGISLFLPRTSCVLLDGYMGGEIKPHEAFRSPLMGAPYDVQDDKIRHIYDY